MTTGSLSVLNVGAGDIAIVFNQHDDGETAKAITMLTDMLARGYALLIQLDDGSYVRAKTLDATRGRYIVQLPPGASHAAAEPLEDGPPLKRRRGRPKKTGTVAIPVRKARATGVARSAGG